MPDELWRLGAAETALLVRRGDASVREVVRSHLGRIESANGELNALTVVTAESALARAHALDARIAEGDRSGALLGVPVTVKENIDQAGLATSHGVPAMKDLVAPADAPAIRRLEAAGAVFVGRTNTPEFNLRWHTENPLYGRTLNPFDAATTPGGSSGGGAAAVAAGMGALAIGTDLGGSIRYPAYCCGVVGLKPTLGRVPAHNETFPSERPPAIQLFAATGPLARSVADARLALEAMAGADPDDVGSVPAPLDGPPTERRVAVSTGPEPHPAVLTAVEEAADHLADAGYALDWLDPPALDEIATDWGSLVMSAEVRETMLEAIEANGSADIRALVETVIAHYPRLDLGGYMRGLARRSGHLRAWSRFLEERPLILLPSSLEPPFKAGDDTTSTARCHEMIRAQRPMTAINLLGLPSVAVPTGLADGVPVGVQIVGPRYREDLCLAAAQALEDRAGRPTDALIEE